MGIPKREKLLKIWFELCDNITPVFSGIPSKSENEEYRLWYRTKRNPARYNYPLVPSMTLTQWSEEWLSFMIHSERESQKEREDFLKWQNAKRKKQTQRKPQPSLPKMKRLQPLQTNQKLRMTGNSFDPARKSVSFATKCQDRHSENGNRRGKPISR